MTGIEYLTSEQSEVLRDLAEPIAGIGDSDTADGALLIYVLPEAISQTWADGTTHTVAAGTWAREVAGGSVIAYRTTQDVADALAERDDA